MRRTLSSPTNVTIIMVLQFIAFILFPPSSYSLSSQEWWLPVLLGGMTLVSVFQLVVRHSTAVWPWYLISFAQGFNIISRLMLVMPHATYNVSGVQDFNTLYVIFSLISILISTAMLWYTELPEVRNALVRE